MNAVHQTFAPFLRIIAPPSTPSRPELTPADPSAIDRAMLIDKLTDTYNRCNDAAAMALQIKHGDAA